MALRFRKSFKIAPGVRINLSKSGVSTSVGGKGITANLSKRGTRLTTGIPGTGLSSSTLYKSRHKAPAARPGEYSTAEWVTAWVIGEILAVVGVIHFQGGMSIFCGIIAALIPLGLFQYYRPKRNV